MQSRPTPEVVPDVKVCSPFVGKRDRVRGADSLWVILTHDTEIQTLGFLKIMISLLIFSWYIFSSSLICPSSIHCSENSCFWIPCWGKPSFHRPYPCFKGCTAFFENVFRYFGVVYFASKISAPKYDISCILMKMLFQYHVARLCIYSSPKYLDRPWKCSQLRQVWFFLMTMLIQLFSFDFLSLGRE